MYRYQARVLKRYLQTNSTYLIEMDMGFSTWHVEKLELYNLPHQFRTKDLIYVEIEKTLVDKKPVYRGKVIAYHGREN